MKLTLYILLTSFIFILSCSQDKATSEKRNKNVSKPLFELLSDSVINIKIAMNKAFENITNPIFLNHTVVENDFDDLKKEILLPNKMSEEGPAMDVF